MTGDDEKPLSVLPWGRTREQQGDIDRKKAEGRKGLRGCLWLLVAFALVCVYAGGWIAGRHAPEVTSQ